MAWASLLLGTSVLFTVVACFLHRRFAAAMLINVAAALFALGLFESYLVALDYGGDGTRLEGTVEQGFVEPDDLLGYRPRKNVIATARKFFGDDLIYDVTYTIGADGLRISPHGELATKAGCVVFFGDSITFGEGLNDNETYPFRVGVKTNGAYDVYNFAFSGYGPHQMLANLQGGRVNGEVRCSPTQFLYLMIPEHLERAAGLATWDKHGPRYVIAADGTLRRDGNFDMPCRLLGGGTIPAALCEKLDSFHVWQKLFGRERQATIDALPLSLAIIGEAARISRQQYAGSMFDVILWDGNDSERVRGIEAGLTAAGIPVHRITRAIPDFRTNWRAYVISDHDLHPNARQAELIADYIVNHILRPVKSEAAR